MSHLMWLGLITTVVLGLAGHTVADNRAILSHIYNEWLDYALQIQERRPTFPKLETKPVEVPGNKSLQTLLEEFVKKVQLTLTYNDPFSVPWSYQFNTDTSLIRLVGYVDELVISDFSNFTLPTLSIDDSLNFKIAMNFKDIEVTGLYDIDLNLLTLFPAFGSGQLGLLINGFNISFEIQFWTGKNQTLHVSDFQLDLSLFSIMTDFGGLGGNEEISDFINGVLSDTGADIINQYKSMILEFANPIIGYELDQILVSHNITLPLVIEFMQKFVG